MAFQTASTNRPMSLPSEYQNQTYQLNFDGPMIQCKPAKYDLVYNLSISEARRRNHDIPSAATTYTKFASWVSTDNFALNMTNGTRDHVQLNLDDTLDTHSAENAKLFVMTNTGSRTKTIIDPANSDDSGRSGRLAMKGGELNVTECRLYNATYDVRFDFEYPNQTRDVTISYDSRPLTINHTTLFRHKQLWPYAATMQAFGRLLVGEASHSRISSTTYHNQTSWWLLNVDWFDKDPVPTILEQLFQNITLSLLSDPDL